MENSDSKWSGFCNLYYGTAVEYARASLSRMKARLGKLDRHVDENYVIDEAVLMSLEKVFLKFDSARGSVAPLLFKVVHNELVEILERENRLGARKTDLENVESVLQEQLRYESMNIPREDLVMKLTKAISLLPPSDRIILECYLEDRRTFIANASSRLNISGNYVSVRKNRILHQLPKLMSMTRADYRRWLSEHEPEQAFASSRPVAGKTGWQTAGEPADALCGKLALLLAGWID